MKLIFCGKCHDMVKLIDEKRYCKCKSVWGYYVDDLNAVISNDAIPFGIDNNSFAYSYQSLNKFKDLSFKAFFINDDCETITRELTIQCPE